MKMLAFLISFIPLICVAQGLERHRFEQIIDEVTGLYLEELHARKGVFFIKKDWESREQNAEALSIYSREGREWGLHFHGGLARHKLMSESSFALIVCHEIGHFLGGLPYKRGHRGEVSWSSAEGQADAFAAGKCLKRYLLDLSPELQQRRLSKSNEDKIRTLCQKTSSRKICEVTHRSGFNMSSYFRQRRSDQGLPTGEKIGLDFSNLGEVGLTLSSHPTPLCRMATLSSAALCSLDDFSKDYCERPRCWYKPDLNELSFTD